MLTILKGVAHTSAVASNEEAEVPQTLCVRAMADSTVIQIW